MQMPGLYLMYAVPPKLIPILYDRMLQLGSLILRGENVIARGN